MVTTFRALNPAGRRKKGDAISHTLKNPGYAMNIYEVDIPDCGSDWLYSTQSKVLQGDQVINKVGT